MAINDGSGVGLRCKVGDNTTSVDTVEDCTLLGGKVVKKQGGGGTICGGCGQALFALGKSLGWGEPDGVDAARSFVEAATRATPEGKLLLTALAKVDAHFNDAVDRNPAVLGAVVPALMLGADLARLLTAPPGGPTDRLVFPKVTQKYLQQTIVELAKGSDDHGFLEALASLERGFAHVKDKTVGEIRTLLLGHGHRT